MSTRTIADIEADIIAVKNANPNWLANAGVIALITSLTTQINDLSASMQPAGNYLHTTFNYQMGDPSTIPSTRLDNSIVFGRKINSYVETIWLR